MVIERFKWIKNRRVILKTIKGNFKSILNECEQESTKFVTGNISVKFYCKILKQARAKRNIHANNNLSDIYDSALLSIIDNITRITKQCGKKDIEIEYIKTSLKVMYKTLRKALIRNSK